MAKPIVRFSKYMITASVVVIIIVIGFVIYGQMMGTPSGLSEANAKLLRQVDSLLPQRQAIIETRSHYIDSVARSLEARSATRPLSLQYADYKQLFMQSHLVKFSYSLEFPRRMMALADRMADPARKAEAQAYLAYSMCRGGLFKEAVDSFNAIHVSASMPDSVLAAVYLYGGRIWHDMADYADLPQLSLAYKQQGNELLRRALSYIDSPVNNFYVKGKILLWQDRLREARPYYIRALSLCRANDVEARSILYSSLASIDLRLHNVESATHYYLLSVQNDVNHAIVETVAIRGLAQLLYDQYKDAYKSSALLMAAMDNAKYFGTRYRLNAMGTLVPLLQGQKESMEKSRKKTLVWAVGIVLALVLVLMVILWQNLRYSKKLYDSRTQLAAANRQLDEANLIKNQYLGYYMDRVSELVMEIDGFALVAEQKIKVHQEDALMELVKQLHGKFNKKVVKEEFDHNFMLLFPTFVEDFNALMTDDGKQVPTKPSSLTPVLRIFALIRLGITDNNHIARVLDYSFNTVYNYRVRTRNKSIDPTGFEELLLKIGT